MTHPICPVWLGHVLASPIRRWFQDPRPIVRPYLSEGSVALEPGPGMGFFTLEMARVVGPGGRVVAVDVQPRMLAGLRRRAERAGLAERIDLREVKGEHLPVDDLLQAVDFVLAFAMVHEVPSTPVLFGDLAGAMKPDAKLLLAEPTGHVTRDAFAATLEIARTAGLEVAERPKIRWSHAAVLKKS